MAARARQGVEKRAAKRRGEAGAGDRDYTPSGGNVFADLGLPDAGELLVKARLAAEIARIVGRKGWTQARAAKVTGLDQPKVSNLLRGRLQGFSTDRLLQVLNRLGRRVEVRVSAREYGPEKARTSVTVA